MICTVLICCSCMQAAEGDVRADLGAHDAHTQQEGKEQLVLLEQAAADIAIESIGEVLLNVGQAY